jgi:uncharacterized damage-inducible protein DinB
MRIHLRTVLACILVPASVAFAQDKPSAPVAPAPNPVSAHMKMMFGVMKEGMVLSSAAKMPEEHYSFKPTEAVRTYGQILGHIADVQYIFCSLALGEKNPALKIEQTKTSKADLIAALKDSIAYCDRAYDGLTDASGVQTVRAFGGDTPRLSVLTVHLTHTSLHYGNLVTYMRMKDVVPPSSEPGFGRPVKK